MIHQYKSTDATCPSPSKSLHQDLLFSHGPEESKLFQLPSGVRVTHCNSFSYLPFRKSGYRDSGVRGSRGHNPHTKQNPDPRWSTVNNLYSGISLSGNRSMRCHEPLTPLSPEPRTPIARADLDLSPSNFGVLPPASHFVLGTHLATSSSGFRGSRIRGTSFFWCRKPRNAEPRYPGSDATCPSDDRWLPLIREIATLTSPFPERRKPDLSGFVPPVLPMIDGSR
jgi:hypothetical protein